MKTSKFFDCNFGGHCIVIEYHHGTVNPFRIYRKHWDGGWHKTLLDKYQDFNSCMCFVDSYYRENTNVRSETIV